jgi:hypothetical protein
MLTAYKAQAINFACNRLRDTLKRCDPALSDSLRLQATQLVKECLRQGYKGQPEIHPGMAKMAKWGKCSERQAKRNMRTLEGWRVAQVVSDQRGGKRATRYWVEPEFLLRRAMVLGANPSPDLVAEIRDLIDGFRGDSRGDMRGDTCHDTCHPEIRSISYVGQIQNRQNALCETRGGSDA